MQRILDRKEFCVKKYRMNEIIFKSLALSTIIYGVETQLDKEEAFFIYKVSHSFIYLFGYCVMYLIIGSLVWFRYFQITHNTS